MTNEIAISAAESARCDGELRNKPSSYKLVCYIIELSLAPATQELQTTFVAWSVNSHLNQKPVLSTVRKHTFGICTWDRLNFGICTWDILNFGICTWDWLNLGFVHCKAQILDMYMRQTPFWYFTFEVDSNFGFALDDWLHFAMCKFKLNIRATRFLTICYIITGPEAIADNPMLPVSTQDITLGKPRNVPSYGWDNEYGQRDCRWALRICICIYLSFYTTIVDKK